MHVEIKSLWQPQGAQEAKEAQLGEYGEEHLGERYKSIKHTSK